MKLDITSRYDYVKLWSSDQEDRLQNRMIDSHRVLEGDFWMPFVWMQCDSPPALPENHQNHTTKTGTRQTRKTRQTA